MKRATSGRRRRRPSGTGTRAGPAGVGAAGREPCAGSADPLLSGLPFLVRIPHAWAAAIPFALALVAFLTSLGNGFALDDNSIIVENSLIQDLANLRIIFMSPYWQSWNFGDLLYRPLVITSIAINYAVSGLRPFSYHLVNVLLHAGNSALVYAVTCQVFRQRGLALLAAAAFALHPIHTEVVANVTGRSELLAAMFLFIAWLLYVLRDAAPSEPAGAGRSPLARALLLGGSALSFALALLSKEHAVILPFLLVLSDALRETRRVPAPSQAGLMRALWRRLVTGYLLYLVVLAGYLLVRVSVLGTLRSPGRNSVLNPLLTADFSTRLLTAMRILGKYLLLLVAPVRLSADYSYNQVPLASSAFEPDVLLPVLGVAAIAWFLRRRALLAFGFVVFLVTLAPVLNIFFPIGTIMAERLLYFPSFGFCIALAGLVALATERIRDPRWLRWLPIGAFVLLLVLYGGKTVVRNQVWASDLALWRATVVTSPDSAAAHRNLALELMNLGDLEAARLELVAALRILPSWWDARQRLGAVLLLQNRLDEAVAEEQEAIRLEPQAPEPHYNLGRAYEIKGWLPEARREFQRAASLALQRGSPHLYVGIGVFFYRHGELAEAERWFQRAVEAWPLYIDAHVSLGGNYWKQGRLSEAGAAFTRALEIDPNSAKAHQGLGLVLRAQGREEEAKREFNLAVQQARVPSADRRGAPER